MDRLGFRCLCISAPDPGRCGFLRLDGEVAAIVLFFIAVCGVAIDYLVVRELSFCIKLSHRFRWLERFGCSFASKVCSSCLMSEVCLVCRCTWMMTGFSTWFE